MADRPGATGEPGGAFLDLLLGLISLSERMLASSADLAAVPQPPPPTEAPQRKPPSGPLLR